MHIIKSITMSLLGRNNNRILFVGHLPPPSSGHGNVLLTYFQILPKKGYEVRLINSGRLLYNSTRSVFLYIFRAFRISYFLIFTIIKWKPKYVSLMLTSNFFMVIRLGVLCFISQSIGCRVVAQHHAGELLTKWSDLNYFYKLVIRFVITLPNGWVAPGQIWKDYLQERGVHENRIAIIPNSIKQEIVPLTNNVRNIKKGNKKDVLKVLFVGNITRRKGLDILLGAIDILEDKSSYFEFIVLGGEGKPGERDKIMKSYYDSIYGKKVEFLMPIEGENYLRLLMSSDIFILPSYAENLPIALLEAMSTGLTCVVSNVGAIPEVIGNNERGLLFNIGDSNQLAIHLLKLYDEPEFRFTLGHNAQIYIRDYHLPEKSCDLFIKFINKIS